MQLPIDGSGWSNQPKPQIFCASCAVAVSRILKAPDKEGIFNKTIDLCTQLAIANDVFCEGIITENEATVEWLYNNTDNVTPRDICSTIFPRMGCTTNNPDSLWEVEMPNVPKPPVNEPVYPQGDVPTLKILHLSDTHFDPNYLPGSNANCPEVYLCCNHNSGPLQSPEDAAGFWGDYRKCDLPKWTLEKMYQHITDTHPDIDFIIWTGDLVPHVLWNTSRSANLEAIRESANLLLEYFPEISVYPSVGNHEADPVDLFPQPYIDDPEFDISWLYDELASIWSNWLPSDTATSVAYSAYYSATIKPGLRIVSINSNYGYSFNWWLLYDSKDVADQLQNLAQELQDAEDVGDKVYIIAHHPPGDMDCELNWSHQFSKIVYRYEDTITGMFFGHTHYDHYEIFFDPENTTRPYEVAYIAQSQTPYSNLNPGYKIYSVEGDFNGSRFRVLDHENWMLDLDKSNTLNRTLFTKLYSAKEEYGLYDLSPQSWSNLVYEMNAPNSSLFNDFYRNYVRGASPSMEKGCDSNCKNKILCRIVIADNSDHSQCDTLSSGKTN